jgi:hypothetical protein
MARNDYDKDPAVTSSPAAAIGCGSLIKTIFVGVISATLWIAAEVAAAWQSGSPEDDSEETSSEVSTAVRVIFAAGVLFPLASLALLVRGGACRQKSTTTNTTPTSTATGNQDVWWIFVPSLSLLMIMFLRLVAGQKHFQTFPPNIDFGPKYGLVYADDGAAVETNIAFDPEFNTVTHCLQGVFAAILAFVGALMSQSGRRWHWIVSMIASALTIYPIYNFVKRVIKSHETFATSSFSNNGMEWAFGFWGGLACGQCVYYYFLTRRQSATDGPIKSNLLEGEAGGDNKQTKLTTPRIITILRSLLAGALWITVYGSAVLYGYTWNNCQAPEDDNQECIFDPSDGANVGVIIGYVLVPIVFSGVAYCWLRKRLD